MTREVDAYRVARDHLTTIQFQDTVTVTEDHLTLLSAAWTSWDPCEFGAVEIDPKRPYGNGDVAGDLAELLPHLDARRRAEVHAELVLVLNAVLSTRSFATGRYEREKYSNRWRYVANT
jgi:hypothetical protein